MMEYISLFAGIGGFEEALRRAGAKCVASVEIDKQAQSVLRKQFPDTEIWDDVKTYKPSRTVDLVCGGFPCQDLSIAGKREGLDGERSGLWFEFHRIITECHPRWVVIENVPGLLSSNDGRDFAVVIGGLTGVIPQIPAGGWGNAGFFRGPIYKVAYRVLDAQFYGVAQRRRRVFFVGYLGDGRAAEILFERQSVSWNPPARKGAGQGVAATLRGRSAGSSHAPGRGGEDEYNLISHALSASKTATGRLDPNGQDFVVGTLDRKSCASNRGSQANEADFLVAGILPDQRDIDSMYETGQGFWQNGDVAGTLRAEGENRPSRPSNVIAYNIQHNDGGDHKRSDRPNGGLYVTETDTVHMRGSPGNVCSVVWKFKGFCASFIWGSLILAV